MLDPEINDIVEALEQETLTLKQPQNLVAHLNFPHEVFIQAYHFEEDEQQLHPYFVLSMPEIQNHPVKLHSV